MNISNITQYLNISITSSVMRDLIDALPPGWILKFESCLFRINELISIQWIGLDIKNGVLYLKHDESSIDHDLVQYLTRSISQESARTCMMCSLPGRRRKEQTDAPPLCRPHYLEYINRIEA